MLHWARLSLLFSNTFTCDFVLPLSSFFLQNTASWLASQWSGAQHPFSLLSGCLSEPNRLESQKLCSLAVKAAGLMEAWTIRRTCGDLEACTEESCCGFRGPRASVVWKGWALGCGITTFRHQLHGHQDIHWALGTQVWLAPV